MLQQYEWFISCGKWEQRATDNDAGSKRIMFIWSNIWFRMFARFRCCLPIDGQWAFSWNGRDVAPSYCLCRRTQFASEANSPRFCGADWSREKPRKYLAHGLMSGDWVRCIASVHHMWVVSIHRTYTYIHKQKHIHPVASILITYTSGQCVLGWEIARETIAYGVDVFVINKHIHHTHTSSMCEY